MRTPAIAVSATALLLAAALSGCGTSAATGTSGLSAVTPSAGVITPTGDPTATPTDTPTTTGTPTTSTTTTPATTRPPAAPSYPNTAQAYATVTLKAYAGRNKTFLAAYTDAAGAVSFEFLGSFNRNWHFYTCSADGALTDCFFDNDNGDRINVVIDPTVLGQAHATHGASIDRTEFGSSADDMVNAFMSAIFNHNIYREKIFADANTYKVFAHRAYPTAVTLTDSPASNPTGTFVSISDGANDPITVLVPDSKLGHSHAISIPDA